MPNLFSAFTHDTLAKNHANLLEEIRLLPAPERKIS
jgi:hypothetical protein